MQMHSPFLCLLHCVAYHFQFTSFSCLPFVLAPVTTEFFLKVQRSYDNKTLVVSWQPAILEPPLGPVALYEVQYRDAQQSVITTAHVQPETPFLVIRDVANANDYEVSSSLKFSYIYNYISMHACMCFYMNIL